ncbi:hypothetical protein EUGRSUZ_F04084 [Eucalyptus grandis]|uniref:Protein kinase domain-containing protein n=2 Tax=Eucalyptus grandis TaxID=71139 RepID=A0A059BZA2_EUCGR|nr:hypothetical protein EUGRSUZ_F04084 [Eucalyptus grandis]
MGHSCLNCPQLHCSSVLFTVLLLLHFNVVIYAPNDKDKLALLAFKAEITSDPFGSLCSWNDNTDFYRWQRVKCDRRNHIVMVLNLNSQGLSGSISPHIRNLSLLRVLSLTNNRFGLEIPSQVGQLCWLQAVYLSHNSLTSEIPGNILGCSNLEFLHLDYKQLVGGIPMKLGSLSNLIRLCGKPINRIVLAGNGLNGIISQSLGQLTKLKTIASGTNQLSGNFPPSVFNLSSFVEIDRHCNLVSLQRLDTRDNLLSGLIPSNLGNLSNVAKFDLSDDHLSVMRNNFSGPVIFPVARSLLYLDLSRNHLSGVLSMETRNLRHLDEWDVLKNILDGELLSNLSNLGNCDALTILRMQDNLFHGSIPQSISSLRSIEEIDLSNNNFYCEIPKLLEAFQYLEKLNLSYKHLESVLPTQGVFKNVSATFVVGNEKFCGGTPEFDLPECISRNSKSRGVHKLKLTIAILFGLLGITLIITFLYLCWLKQKKKKTKKLIASSSNDSLLNLRIEMLLRFNLMRHDALKSFKAECEALKRIKHQNILKVLTVCSSIDYKGDEFKALVYEFMVNGSLEEWLHPNPAPNDVDGHSKKLSLIQRINISIDVTFALDYLHNQCESKIIHCEPKPSNVLLDANMVGCVGNFGLVKIVHESTSNTRASLSSTDLRGTFGHAGPQMFTRLSPTSNMFRDNLNLHNYVADALPQRDMEITNPVLLHEGESHSSSQDSLHERNRIFQECLETIYHTGLACSVEDPRRHMSIDKVAIQLHSIRKKLFVASLLE